MIVAMEKTDRIAKLAREKGKVLARTLHLRELQAAGAARALALHEADEQLERIAQRLPDALSAGLSVTEISRSSGVSRQTVYELKARQGTIGDVRLAVLQAVMLHSPITTQQIAKRLKRPTDEVSRVASELFDKEWIDVESLGYVDEDGGREPAWCCTFDGYQTLEQWTFDEGEGQG
jgi:cell division protein ZapA (FtsZ GTPase activity inhibitor)